jgi:uncharacterized protein YceH (UPF0502 family)
MEPLTAEEIRVLGSLIEKEMTTPEYYPLTMNALVNACNQKSSREPVVNYDEDTVAAALDALRARGFAVRISGAGHRVEKYAHTLGEKWNLGRREAAILCVLMLRGPQTLGELRSRTERMHNFSDMDEVERVLEALAAREPDPLAVSMPRGRWAQLLGGPPQQHAEQTAPYGAARPASLETTPELEQRIAALEREIEALKREFAGFRKQFE